MSEPVLSHLERDSAAWQKLKKHFNARLSELRLKNDNDMTEAQSIRLRARIAEIKYLLGLGEDKPLIEPDAFKD